MWTNKRASVQGFVALSGSGRGVVSALSRTGTPGSPPSPVTIWEVRKRKGKTRREKYYSYYSNDGKYLFSAGTTPAPRSKPCLLSLSRCQGRRLLQGAWQHCTYGSEIRYLFRMQHHKWTMGPIVPSSHLKQKM